MKIRNLFLLLGGSAALFFTACSSSQNLTDAQLSNKWMLKSIKGTNAGQAFEQSVPYVVINASSNRISGNSGCNNFNGGYAYQNGQFSAPNLAGTMMACIFQNEEPLFLSLLKNTSSLSIVNEELIFTQNNTPVLVFSKAQPLGANELSGTWKLLYLEGRSSGMDFTNTIPTLEFNFSENKLSGTTGCNRYNATFTLNDNILKVMPLAMTRMACENMEGEAKFVNLFSGDFDLEIQNNNVLHLKRNGIFVMSFSK